MKGPMAIGVLKARPLALLAAVASALALVLGLAGLGAERANAAGPCNKWGDKPSDELTTGHARKAVLCLLNRERHARGIPDLRRDRKLQRAAQKHNDYMQRKRCFSHECPGEPSLTGRLQRVGWLTGGLSGWAYGENIAWAPGNGGTPEGIVRMWMNSSGHRANILNRRYDEVGVGYTEGTITNKNAIGAIMTTDFGWKTG
jgi:uncharacterized protein YkwD